MLVNHVYWKVLARVGTSTFPIGSAEGKYSKHGIVIILASEVDNFLGRYSGLQLLDKSVLCMDTASRALC